MSSCKLSVASSITPILLDQIAITNSIKFAPGSLRYKPAKVQINSLWAIYVSDPVTYKNSSGFDVYKLFGRKVTTSNGRRLFLAHVENPIPHYLTQTDKRTIDKSIEKFELGNNQFEEKELKEIESRFGSKCHKELMKLFVSAFEGARKDAVEHFKTLDLLPMDDHGNNFHFNRIEIYTEVQADSIENNLLAQSFRRVLEKAFGSSDFNRGFVEEVRDKRLQDKKFMECFLAWDVSPRLVSDKFSSKKKFRIKFYKKGERVRIEIQANNPKVGSKRNNSNCNAIKSLRDNGLKICDELGLCLQSIVKHAEIELSKVKDKSGWISIRNLLTTRLAELCPRSKNDIKFHQLIKDLTEKQFTTTDALKKLGIGRESLKKMIDPKFGFLVVQDGSVQGLDKRCTKKVRKKTYRLDIGKLKNTDRPNPKQSKKQFSDEINLTRAMEYYSKKSDYDRQGIPFFESATGRLPSWMKVPSSLG